MDYDSIMREIASGLTGEPKADMKFLKEQCEKYKDHEFNQEILRACGRMMDELISNEKKEEFSRIMKNDNKAIEITLDEIRFNVYKKNIAKAFKLSEALVKKVDECPMFQNDSVSEYYTFDEFFEELLYRFYNKPERTLRRAELPFAEIYLQHGSLLFEQKRYSEARAVLEKARRWNPASVKIAFEYMETFKVQGEIEQFAVMTKETFKYAFRSADVARCYRNLGYYFIEKKLYAEASGCYLMSLQFEKDNKAAQSELYYIQAKASKRFKQPTIDDIRKYGAKYGFPVGAANDVLGLAFAYGKRFAEDRQKEGALYCFNIAYELTGDEGIKKIMDNLGRSEN